MSLITSQTNLSPQGHCHLLAQPPRKVFFPIYAAQRCSTKHKAALRSAEFSLCPWSSLRLMAFWAQPLSPQAQLQFYFVD